MNKKEIIEKIREVTGCTEEKAEVIFQKGIDDEHIVVKVDWEWIVNRVIIAAIIVTGLWALWRLIG
jgi:hypothetical protein